MSTLKGRVAVISGAETSLGKAAALAFAAEGANIALLGHRFDLLKQTSALLTELAGAASMPLLADVTDDAAVQAAVDAVLQQWGRIDVLLGNADVPDTDLKTELPPDERHKLIATYLTGPFQLTQAVLPSMRRKKYGRIIHIAYSLSRHASAGLAAYAEAKAGLESLTRNLAREEREHGILVNLYNPGMLRSEKHGTGKDPSLVTPDLIRLASLSFGGPTGTIHSYG